MITDAGRPWLAHYPAGRPASVTVEFESALALFTAAVAAAPDAPAVCYFGRTLSWAELDRASDALASLLVSRGFAPGDRLALYLQNDPAFVVGLLAAWKARGIAALVSPMSKRDELDLALRDFAPAALLALDDLYEDVARGVLQQGDVGVHTVVTVSPSDEQDRGDPRVFEGMSRRRPADTLDLYALVGSFSGPGPQPAAPARSDVAVLAPTSGTTGEPKAAMLTHGNLAFNAQTYRDWTGLRPGEPVLAMAPVFHVTGLVAGILVAFLLRSPLVLTHRFHPAVVLDAIRECRPVFAVAPITAYIALAEEPALAPGDLSSLRLAYSGGSPILPEVADRLETVLGRYIHNVYGQTEASSPTHMVPPGTRAPVDPETGVLSVGLPVFDTMVRVVDDRGATLPPGRIGELVTDGPQVAPGYWRRPDETALAFVDGALKTGDVGFMDADGWFYVVDRSTDLINAAGYKVWPHEVEQVLATHPAVQEAAVVAIADDYRGQSTRAYVALRPEASATEVELIEYCRGRMAAYKYPREIEIVHALPRSVTGKLLRRELRRRRPGGRPR
ncbi:AMP-binding protein [Pseudonocardia kujensis]|uniref:class I adenylate-forming enzyme family protein n=1 Tax=Pseudonocardia kujensis TaxID=1128675 RepID=UPI001E5E38D9|nr:AMP-binding protein [Pseudonocardia kujensis]MCE0763030.1 AMP-binding protein [Pseudonocardia kujensis]